MTTPGPIAGTTVLEAPRPDAVARRRVYCHVLSALAEPGVPRNVGRGPQSTVMTIYQAIWDSETTVHSAPGLLVLPGIQTTVHEASVVHLRGDDSDALAVVTTGTDLEPQLGATVLVMAASTVTPVRLAGPGIDGERQTSLPVSRAALEARDARCAIRPRGADLIVIDGHLITGLPRTTTVTFAG